MSAAVVAAVKARLAAKGKSNQADIKDMLTMNGLETKYKKMNDGIHQQINHQFPISEEAKEKWFDKLVDELIAKNIEHDTENWLGTFPCGQEGTEFEHAEKKCLEIITIIYKSYVLKNLLEVRKHQAGHLLNWMRCEAEKVKPTQTRKGMSLKKSNKYLQKDNTCNFPPLYDMDKGHNDSAPLRKDVKQSEMDKFIEIAKDSLEELKGLKFEVLLDAEMDSYCKCNKNENGTKIVINRNFVYPDDALACLEKDKGVGTDDVAIQVRQSEAGRRRRRRKSRKKGRKSRRRRKSRRKSKKSRRKRRRTRRRRR